MPPSWPKYNTEGLEEVDAVYNMKSCHREAANVASFTTSQHKKLLSKF